MKILFVDNFRGFSHTHIPIKDVNFLVGENSTGKTSILGLMKLMSTPYFWLGSDFNTPEVNFGHFSDIVSVSASDRTQFSVGFIETVGRTQGKARGDVRAFLLTFCEHEGLPRPAFYAFYHEGSETCLRLVQKGTRYRKNTIPPYTDVNAFVRDVYSKWISTPLDDQTGYEAIPKEVEKLSDAPPMVLASALQQALEKKPVSPHGPFRAVGPLIEEDITWLAPIRTKPRRTYDEYKLTFSPEGDHTPYLIKKFLETKSGARDFKKFLARSGSDTGLFDSIRVKRYGRGATSPFELDIILNEKALSISNVGYGVSQALPVIVEVFARPKDSWFAIQQPEVHLHPKAQAALGDIFFELAVKENKKFLVETHSDYTIDRFRLNYKRKKLARKPEAQVLYFERLPTGNKIFQLEIQPNGELPDEQPQGYRDFFVKEQIRLLGL